ncbi:NAD(P)/FAD-dependent oxidoreductase [Luteimonas sp. RD2P54]|uniref:NAD(P)/FAD-dependent oxidoreductase n=1 Tax=Luteimonas endophytica TaxID=3042023 RepID=A0ABT6JCA4_9GAMM|nr:NAD(P)/FAD-dependent oxidoreductase [Luteimonas endophytica]MDH5824461.1 NAD(P)/FAD-dependent oxidoreductase [Luteimonas endophytica]
MTLHVGIVGYGSAGQAAALMLARDGHRVEVFERVPAPRPVGAGFLLQPVGLEVLWELGLLDAAMRHGARIERLHGETGAGRAVMDMRYRELQPLLFGLGMQRAALFSLLDRAWDGERTLHTGCEIVSIDAAGGTLVAADGARHGRFDLLVVADGAASRLRGMVQPARLDRAYPWGAQWCLVPAGDWPWPDELRQRYVRARRMAGMLPVGTRPDDPVPRMSFFWSLPAAAMEPAAWTGEDSWRRDLAAVWPQAAAWLRATPVPDGLAQARYRDAVHRRWFEGRAVLIGDAAHAMSPQLGQGVNMALLDARALRDALRSHRDPAAALPAFQRERRAHVGIYHVWSRLLTPVFQSDRDGVAALRDLAMHPLTRVPGLRGQSLRVLTGTRRGWFGRQPLSAGFLRQLAVLAEARAAGRSARAPEAAERATP